MSETDFTDVVALTAALVACPSHAEIGERDAAKVAQQAMEALGYQDVTIDALGNVTGVIPGTGVADGCVVFDGHLDTVGVGDPDAWMTPPFKATKLRDNLHGRGTADMKGAIAAMISGIARLLDEPPACDVIVSASIAEEMVEGYALGAVLDRYPAKAVVIGEATQLKLARAQRGRAEILIETLGIPAHSSTPQLGVNAVKTMARLISALSALEMPDDQLLGTAVLEVTDVISEPYPGLSVIPERCLATFDRRLLPGETEEQVLGQVDDALDKLKADLSELQAFASIAVDRFTSWNDAQVEAPNFAPAWVTDESSPTTQAALEALRSVGIDAQLGHYAFCTNGSEAARRGIPTLGFGPGHEAQAHTIDEFVEIAQLEQAADGYAALARGLARI